MGADTKCNRRIWGGGALERRHGASLEPLAERGDALGGVGAFSMYDAAELAEGQTAKGRKEVNGR